MTEKINEYTDKSLLPEKDVFDVPAYKEPLQETFDTGESFTPGELSNWVYEYPEGTLEITVAGTKTRPTIDAKSDDLDISRGFWTAVQWAREYGVPGVCRERFKYIRNGVAVYRFSLGGLYRYVNYSMSEREANYKKYGENPKTK